MSVPTIELQQLNNEIYTVSNRILVWSAQREQLQEQIEHEKLCLQILETIKQNIISNQTTQAERKDNTQIRILCLHGAVSTAAKLRKSMSGLIQKGKKQGILFDFLESPHPCPVVKEDKEETKQWWSFGTKEDLFNSKEYDTGEESLQLLRDYWLAGYQEHNNRYRYDGLLGFSQGSALAQIFVFDAVQRNDPKCLPKGLILSGTFEVHADKYRWDASQLGLIDQVPVLVCSGEKDSLVTKETSVACAQKIFSPSSLTLHTHAGGHYVPSRSDSIQVVLDFITAYCVSTASAY